MISLFFLYDSELRARHFAISCHQGRISGFFASALNTCNRSPSTLPASPMIGISTRMFLLIEDGALGAGPRQQVCVAIVLRHVGLVGAVQAELAEPVLARCRIGAETHQGG